MIVGRKGPRLDEPSKPAKLLAQKLLRWDGEKKRRWNETQVEEDEGR